MDGKENAAIKAFYEKLTDDVAFYFTQFPPVRPFDRQNPAARSFC